MRRVGRYLRGGDVDDFAGPGTREALRAAGGQPWIAVLPEHASHRQNEGTGNRDRRTREQSGDEREQPKERDQQHAEKTHALKTH
jgi:hypothetical protein